MNPSYRPETSWLKTDAPHLRIISDELWDAAHERLTASRETYLRCHENGRFWSKPSSGLESKFLLTGLSRCAVCGRSMICANGSPQQRKRGYHYYRCGGFLLRKCETISACRWKWPTKRRCRSSAGGRRSACVGARLTPDYLRPVTLRRLICRGVR